MSLSLAVNDYIGHLIFCFAFLFVLGSIWRNVNQLIDVILCHNLVWHRSLMFFSDRKKPFPDGFLDEKKPFSDVFRTKIKTFPEFFRMTKKFHLCFFGRKKDLSLISSFQPLIGPLLWCHWGGGRGFSLKWCHTSTPFLPPLLLPNWVYGEMSGWSGWCHLAPVTSCCPSSSPPPVAPRHLRPRERPLLSPCKPRLCLLPDNQQHDSRSLKAARVWAQTCIVWLFSIWTATLRKSIKKLKSDSKKEK